MNVDHRLREREAEPAAERDLVVGPLQAYRYWYMGWQAGRPVLQSLCQSTVWPAEAPMHATCERSGTVITWIRKLLSGLPAAPAHPAPCLTCTCGIYALTRLDDNPHPWLFVNSGTHVGGTVLHWGRVVRHSHGYRAEYARPLKLLAVPYLRKEMQELLVATAQRYKIEIVRRLGSLGVGGNADMRQITCGLDGLGRRALRGHIGQFPGFGTLQASGAPRHPPLT